MNQTFEGSFEGRGLKVAVVVSRFNESITKALLDGALDCLRRHDVRDEDISVTWVPGAFELPLAAKRMALSGDVDAVVCLGAVIKGETAHFEYVSSHALNGIGQVGVDTGIPVTCGVLTTYKAAEATDRAGGKAGNKGFEATLAAIEMANLLSSMPKERPEL